VGISKYIKIMVQAAKLIGAGSALIA